MRNVLEIDLDHILDSTRALWAQMRGERLFLTGGTGFFGCWLMESFLWANQRLNLNAKVTVLTRNPQLFISSKPHLALADAVTLINGDVRSFEFPKGEFSHILHAATESNAKINAENPLECLDTIISGTRHVLDFASQCKAKEFLLISSGAIYGKQPDYLTHLAEEYSGAPNPLEISTSYAQGKRTAEHLCCLYSSKSQTRIKIARCFAFVGPYLPLDWHFAIGNFIRDGLRGGPIVINGDGTPRRSYLYAADLATFLWTILFKGQSLRPYNVGSDHSFSILEVAEMVSQRMPSPVGIEIHGKSLPNKALEQYIPDISRIKHELGVQPSLALEEAISRTVRFAQHKNGANSLQFLNSN